MLFATYIVLIERHSKEPNNTLEKWRRILESKGFRLSTWNVSQVKE